MVGVLDVGKQEEQEAHEYAYCENPILHRSDVLPRRYLTRVRRKKIDGHKDGQKSRCRQDRRRYYAWLSITPLDMPVVPPVYMREARSSNETSVRGGFGGYRFRRSMKSWIPSPGSVFLCIFFFTNGKSCFFGNGR